MASRRLEQETVLVSNEPEPADLCEVVTVTCKAGDCEFFWIVEDPEGESIELPKFCPMCGRRR